MAVQLLLPDFSRASPLATGVLAARKLEEEAFERGIILLKWDGFRVSLPEWGPLKAGKEVENTWNSRLVEALHKVGIPSAEFEKTFVVRKAGKEAQSKPDVTFTNGGIHVISGKFGARKELDAYKSADEYKELLGPALKQAGGQIGEVFAITYPASRGEKFHLHILPRGSHPEISLTLETLDEAAQEIHKALRGLIDELERKQEPVFEEARRLLRWGAEDLALTLKGVNLTALEGIFGGHDFFQSLLRPRLGGEKRDHALRLGAAYLFVNQVLFYVLLSHEASERGLTDQYPPIKPEHFSSPRSLRDEYFERVRSKNYEPIYGFDVAQFFRDGGAEDACESIVRGVLGLSPKLDVPDLVGQVFQGLIPFEIRKPLGAHYTNPRAAALLSRLAVRSADDTVLDPACGSGTLLVAAYRRKLALSDGKNLGDIHRRFVEHEITGFDAMAFVAHLAAVNLALQHPLVETDHVRIGTLDSTAKRPGESVSPTEAALPREFQQAQLTHTFGSGTSKRRKGAVQSSKAGTRSFHLESTDLVIMNPPFTSWDNMGASYREALKKAFAQDKPDYRDAIYWKTSQQAFFLLLADRFLKKGGLIAAVLPITTFTGKAFEPLMNFLLTHYTVKFVVVGLGRSSFSEDTSLAECLAVMEKRSPGNNQTFRLVGTLRPPHEWTDDDVAVLVDAAQSGESVAGRAIVRDCSQKSLKLDQETLAGLVLRLLPEYERAWRAVDEVFARTRRPIVAIENCLGGGVKVKTGRWILGGGWLVHFGSSGLFGYRTAERMVKQRERLVYVGTQGNHVIFEDRVAVSDTAPGRTFRIPRSTVLPALRRFSFLPGPDITAESDFVLARTSRELEETLTVLYGAKDAKKYLTRIKETKKQWKGGHWASLVDGGMTQVSFAGRVNLAAPGTTILACRSDTPFLLAAYGFMARGFRSQREEKLFVLWLNSTLSLLTILDRLTITEGSWVRIEQFVLLSLPTFDFSSLSESEWKDVDALYGEVCSSHWPSLREQLEGHPVRRRIDTGMLTLMGVKNEDAIEYAEALRAGALAAIDLLSSTMGGGKTTRDTAIRQTE